MASPTKNENLRYQAASYRVRLFLSVDLSGSTAFKNSKIGAERQTGATPRWVNAFQRFYDKFPAEFSTKYQHRQNELTGDDQAPQLWKAVGDELVFCGKVSNRKSAEIAIQAFVDTLNSYREHLQSKESDLNLKGAAWLAAFPEPNRAVQLRRDPEDSDVLVTASEELEVAADRRPFDYDFLGKAIDTGFRVARWAKPERFVLSVQLARLLLDADGGDGFGYPIWMEKPEHLKGVNNGEPYPLLYFDTLTHLPVKDVKERERDILGISHQQPTKLRNYLDEYCNVVGTDEITLAKDAQSDQPDPPASYVDLRMKLSEHLAQEATREYPSSHETEPEGETDSLDDGSDLNPLDE